jgi:uncharacterized protein (TIGR02271 family)
MKQEVLMTTQTGTGTLVGFFEDDADARQAVEALHEAGFTSAHIGVAHRGGSTLRSDSSSSSAKEKATSTWDKIKSMFQGNEAEPYADERTQGDLATREITQNPADANRSAANQNYREDQDDEYDTSDLHGSFTGLNIPEQRSRYFQHRLTSSRNGAVVTVNAGDRIAEAESILRRYNADLGDDADSYNYSETETGTSQQPGRDRSQDRDFEGEQNNIQLLGEVLRVHKDRVSRGEVRIRKEVITETQTVQVPVTREELVIERRPVDQASPATGSIGESEIRIPLSEERASVDTSTVVREEVAVGKKPVQEVRDVTGEVRREELVVEDPTKRSA